MSPCVGVAGGGEQPRRVVWGVGVKLSGPCEEAAFGNYRMGRETIPPNYHVAPHRKLRNQRQLEWCWRLNKVVPDLKLSPSLHFLPMLKTTHSTGIIIQPLLPKEILQKRGNKKDSCKVWRLPHGSPMDITMRIQGHHGSQSHLGTRASAEGTIRQSQAFRFYFWKQSSNLLWLAIEIQVSFWVARNLSVIHFCFQCVWWSI